MRIILFIILICSCITQAQVSFEALVDAESVLVGSTFNVKFQLKNAQGQNITAPNFSPFKLVAGPSRSIQSTVINGAMSSSMSYIYTLLATQEGNFKIGPATIQVNGKTLKTNSVNIKVVKSTEKQSASSGKPKVFVVQTLDTPVAYLGQQLILTQKLYTQLSIDNIENPNAPALGEFQKSYIALGFNEARTEVYKGEQYTTKILNKISLFPLKSGRIEIPQFIYRIRVNEGNNDPFGFSMSSIFNSRIETISSNSINLIVKDLPKPIPQSFSGAVGDFSATISKVNKEYSTSDAIQMVLTVQGDGNLNTIKPQLISNDSLFEISESKTSDLIKVAEEPRLINSKKYEYLFTPKRKGQLVLIPKFTYFNTAKSQFITFSDSITINIVESKIKVTDLNSDLDLSPYSSVELLQTPKPLFERWSSWFIIALLIGFTLIPKSLFEMRLKASKEKTNNSETVSKSPVLKNKITKQGLDGVQELILFKANRILKTDSIEFINYDLKLKLSSLDQDDAKQLLEGIKQFEMHKHLGSTNQIVLDELINTISVI